jgi:outer membrane protein OmpA-like peptidoglycan-associated protein
VQAAPAYPEPLPQQRAAAEQYRQYAPAQGQAPHNVTDRPVTADADPADSRGGAGAAVFGGLVGLAAVLVSAVLVMNSVSSARQRLEHPDKVAKPLVAIAQEAEVAYCTKSFKEVLERVLHSCGLGSANERRGCKPADIKTFAAISDADFNALFHPLQDRGGVLMFDDGKDELDDASKQLLEKRWFDRKGARYFFVVARASKTGTQAKNRALSHRRANSVLFHLEEVSGEAKEDLAKQVGLLWLGNEFAQLSDDYCNWPRSRQGECSDEAIYRSAFVSWVDCRL